VDRLVRNAHQRLGNHGRQKMCLHEVLTSGSPDHDLAAPDWSGYLEGIDRPGESISMVGVELRAMAFRACSDLATVLGAVAATWR
jgi:hypothetical protein